jgi:wobble nucleotide-excising tRNase
VLRKIISIRNVGRFLNYSASGDVELKHYNLIFAENGRGKTTLCAALRSLQSGEPAHVLGRATLGIGDAPEIKVLLDGGTATFKRRAWSATVPDLAIFDSTFVSENIYSGDTVDLDHKRNWYRVIVGKQGVALARQIDDLDAASRAKSTDIRERLAAVEALVPQDLAVEAFLTLQEDPAIDVKIGEKERELQAVKEADQIKNRATLSELALPAFPAGFETLLGKTIEGIAADAERRVAGQIKAHAMHDRGETWLSEGLGYIRNNACPFCGQAFDGVAATLIGAYKAYFGEAYNALRIEIAALRQGIENGFGDREIARVERPLDQNAAGVEFWSRYCGIAAPALAGGEGAAGEALRTLRQAALALLDRKAATPLELVDSDAAFTAAKAALAAMQAGAAIYNQAVRAANATIAVKKAATAAADARTVESALTRLRATKKRHEPDARAACHDYESAQAEKKAFEDQKEDAKKKLDDHTEQVIGRYEQTINRLLDDFNAGFRITGTRHGYPGGVASSSYQILINDTAVDLGDERTPLDRPSFRNTLSSGDKSTLALAFFLAQLDHGPDKAAKIVVFDDPFNSQDSFRKNCTIQKIRKCGEACTQVIVLSHDDRFLKLIWDQLAHLPAERKCLRLARIGLRDTTVSEWDIEVATMGQLVADRQALVDYYNSVEGQPRDVVNKIRPVLETYCRNLYPTQFTPADSLGAIIAKIRDAGPAHRLAAVLDDLETLNAYTTPYAHGQPDAVAAPIDDNELQGFVKSTLTITGGC